MVRPEISVRCQKVLFRVQAFMRSIGLNSFHAVFMVLTILAWLAMNCFYLIYLVRRSSGGLGFFEIYWSICLMSLGVEGKFQKNASDKDYLLMRRAFKFFRVSNFIVVLFLFFFIGLFA